MKELAVFRRRRRCTRPLPMSNWLRFYCLFFFREKIENTAAYESRKKRAQSVAKTKWIARQRVSVGHSWRWPPSAGKNNGFCVAFFGLLHFHFHFHFQSFGDNNRSFSRSLYYIQPPPHRICTPPANRSHENSEERKKRGPSKRIAAHKISINPMELNLIILSPLLSLFCRCCNNGQFIREFWNRFFFLSSFENIFILQLLNCVCLCVCVQQCCIARSTTKRPIDSQRNAKWLNNQLTWWQNEGKIKRTTPPSNNQTGLRIEKTNFPF